jgi:pilus assembly protein CpaF
MEGNVITMQEIFSFEQQGIGDVGAVKGRFRATGIRPRFIERFKAFNIPVPYDLFEPRNVLEV